MLTQPIHNIFLKVKKFDKKEFKNRFCKRNCICLLILVNFQKISHLGMLLLLLFVSFIIFFGTKGFYSLALGKNEPIHCIQPSPFTSHAFRDEADVEANFCRHCGMTRIFTLLRVNDAFMQKMPWNAQLCHSLTYLNSLFCCTTPFPLLWSNGCVCVTVCVFLFSH